MAIPRRPAGELFGFGIRRSMALTIQSAPAASTRTADRLESNSWRAGSFLVAAGARGQATRLPGRVGRLILSAQASGK
jgi:hypothetical protein